MPIDEDPKQKSAREWDEEQQHWELEEAARLRRKEREAEESDARDSAIDSMREWFFEQFEDPANQTPWDGEDKRYLYVSGGPYEANDILPEQFGSEYREAWIQEAIETIELDGLEWAPSPHGDFYLHPEDEGEPPADDAEVTAHIAIEIKVRIDELESLLSSLPKMPLSLGHNMPPDEIGLPPYTEDTEEEIHNHLGAIQGELGVETPDKDLLRQSENGLREIAAKITSWLGRKADLVVDEAIKASVKAGVWGALGLALIGVAKKVGEYLLSLT